jgi:hypothetical protein
MGAGWGKIHIQPSPHTETKPAHEGKKRKIAEITQKKNENSSWGRKWKINLLQRGV